MFLGWKKGNTWTEKKRKAEKKEDEKSGAELNKKAGAEGKEKKGWNRKKGALKTEPTKRKKAETKQKEAETVVWAEQKGKRWKRREGLN